MVTGGDISWSSISFSAYLMQQIMEYPREGETTNSRMRQVTTLLMVFYAQASKNPPKGAEIAEYFGVARNVIQETLDLLIERGLLVEEEVPNSSRHGQGRKALQYSIPNEVFTRRAANTVIDL